MNITPHANPLPIATVVNPPTDSLRRDNVQREVISQAAALNPSLAEKGVAQEKERVRTPAQTTEEGFDFSAIQEQAELERSTINKREHEHQSSQHHDEHASHDESTEDTTPSQNQQTSGENATSPEEQRIIKELEARDLEVRAHEQAHALVGGRYTGSPSYSYETGPDGKRYAVEGEVSVDLSKPKSAEETIAKMRKVYKAALAPANPSAQDLRVAAEASRAIADAQTDLLKQRTAQEAEENDLSKPLTQGGPNVSSLSSNEGSVGASFDKFIDSTIAAQENISPSRDQAIDRRAIQIETLYLNINKAYDQTPRNQFELTA